MNYTFLTDRLAVGDVASCFHDAVTKWLRLDDLTAKGPRGEMITTKETP